MTTVVLGRDGNVYDLGKGEFPGVKWAVIDGRIHRQDARTLVRTAFTCTVEDAAELKKATPKRVKERLRKYLE